MKFYAWKHTCTFWCQDLLKTYWLSISSCEPLLIWISVGTYTLLHFIFLPFAHHQRLWDKWEILGWQFLCAVFPLFLIALGIFQNWIWGVFTIFFVILPHCRHYPWTFCLSCLLNLHKWHILFKEVLESWMLFTKILWRKRKEEVYNNN